LVSTHRTRRRRISEIGWSTFRLSAILFGGMWLICRVLPGARRMMSASIFFAS
jgi:hypothetical protein